MITMMIFFSFRNQVLTSNWSNIYRLTFLTSCLPFVAKFSFSSSAESLTMDKNIITPRYSDLRWIQKRSYYTIPRDRLRDGRRRDYLRIIVWPTHLTFSRKLRE